MFKTLANAWKVKDLRSKLLFTIMIILLYRVGAAITVPFVNAEAFAGTFSNTSNGIFSLLNTLSGGFEQASLFALGVSPYITASIVIQLLTVAIPALERLAKQGDEGKQKITVITRYITMGISVITAIGYYLMIKTAKNADGSSANALLYGDWYVAIVMIACFCAGSALVMWLAERINEKGIGNGVSMILFANIIARGTNIVQEFAYKCKCLYYGCDQYFLSEVEEVETYYAKLSEAWGITIQFDKWNYIRSAVPNPWSYRIPSILVLLITTIGILALIWFVVHISDSERRIPVQYAKKVVGRKMYGGRNTNLPLKVNMAGVMPVIFASTILSLPSMILQFVTTKNKFWTGFANFINPLGWFYVIASFILILAFAYFYVSISFNPVEVASNLQQNGGSVPGIRPGKPTSMYIKKVLSRVTFIGALCLSVVSILPTVVCLILDSLGRITMLPGLMGSNSMLSDFIGSGTSIIIVVGVVLETVRDLESQMTMRHYKGFLD